MEVVPRKDWPIWDGALFTLLGMPDPDSQNELRCRVQWDHKGEEKRQEALKELRKIILKKMKSS